MFWTCTNASSLRTSQSPSDEYTLISGTIWFRLSGHHPILPQKMFTIKVRNMSYGSSHHTNNLALVTPVMKPIPTIPHPIPDAHVRSGDEPIQ